MQVHIDWILRRNTLLVAQEAGVKIAINTDAHAIDQLKYMDIGVNYGQKAWLKKRNGREHMAA